MPDILSGFFDGNFSFHNFIPSFHFADILDIIGIAFLFYTVFSWVKRTRAWVLFRGIAIVVLMWLISYVLQLNMMTWIFQNLFNIGVLAAVVIFQPEIRRALEKLGTDKTFSKLLKRGMNQENSGYVSGRTAKAITDAMSVMAASKTGALICVEGDVALGEYEMTGIPLNAEMSAQLLINIFEKNTPLHDGAVIVRGDKIVSATCYLPLSENLSIDKDLGTRHRAALGLSEVSDAKIFVVSEETGAMSMAYNGRIDYNIGTEQIARELLPSSAQKLNHKQGDSGIKLFSWLKGGGRDA